MPSRVLLATDLSEGSLAAARALPHVAEKDAAVTVAHVVPQRAIVGETDPTDEVRAWVERAGLAGAPQAEAEGTDAARGTRRVTVRILRGEPSRALAEEAEALDAGLVVVGSHGARGLERALLGSVAEGVVERAPTSVLVVAARLPAKVGETSTP